MAFSKQFLITLAIVALVLPSVAFATDYVVGDEFGWTVGFDYATWAKDKMFMVRDKLIFKYPPGQHNVFKVNGTAFAACAVPPVSDALVTGNDVITLATPGRKWYFCGVGEHCVKGGQKLAITVMPSYRILEAPAPAPSAANGVVASAFQLLIAATASVAAMIML